MVANLGVEPYNIGTMLPESTIVKCNKKTCDASVNDVKGLGQGRSYN